MKATLIKKSRNFFNEKLIWIFLPVLGFTVIEISARVRFNNLLWYKGAEKIVSEKKIDYIFVGSSRVAAAIDTVSFEKVLSKHLGRSVTTLNMGQGYSTISEHFLGLRNMYAIAPQNLKNTTVFISMETGLPYSDTWSTRWEHPDRPKMIAPLLKSSDINRAWQISSLPWIDKLNLTYLYLSNYLVSLSYRQEIRGQFINQSQQIITDSLQFLGVISKTINSTPQVYKLASIGGIRNDDRGVINARELALKLSKQDIQNQKILRNWDKTILVDLVHLVQKNGGKVIFFETPHSSVQARPLETDLGKANIKIFEAQTKAWCTVILKQNFVTTDSDFPDLWHLNSSLSPKFTVSLAKALIKDLTKQSFQHQANPGCQRS